MLRERFEALIVRLEAQERRFPRLYRLHLAWLAACGYGIFLASAVLVALVLGLTAIVFARSWVGGLVASLLALVLLGWFLPFLKALWVRLEPPKGHRLEPADAPRLFEAIATISGRLGSRRFHDVVLTGEPNAAVVHSLSYGAWGRQRHTLLLGLPLMQALRPDELEAVIAHESAHLSKRHGRFGGWIYRVRRAWAKLADQWEHVAGPLRTRGAAFFRWFWPRFNARAFVLSRACEYEADASSAEVVGAEPAARALCRLALIDRQLSDDFWPQLSRAEGRQAEPPADIFGRMAAFFAQSPEPVVLDRRLAEAFNRDTDAADTHPCLRERIAALGHESAEWKAGVSLHLTTPASPTAADCFLGQAHETLSARIGELWRSECAERWKSRAEAVAAHLHAPAGPGASLPPPLNEVEAWNRALALVSVEGLTAAMPLVDRVLAARPAHAGAHLFKGRFFLEQDDEVGVRWLEQALQLDPRLRSSVFDSLHEWYSRAARREDLADLKVRRDRFEEMIEMAAIERHTFALNSPIVPHGLTPAEHAEAVLVLRKHSVARQAWLVRRPTRLFPHYPDFILVIATGGAKPSKSEEGALQSVIETLALPGSIFLLRWSSGNANLAGRVSALDPVGFYRRED